MPLLLARSWPTAASPPPQGVGTFSQLSCHNHDFPEKQDRGEAFTFFLHPDLGLVATGRLLQSGNCFSSLNSWLSPLVPQTWGASCPSDGSWAQLLATPTLRCLPMQSQLSFHFLLAITK